MTSDPLEILLDLDPTEFERFIADVWQERQGWTTEVTKATRDRGVDVIGQPPGSPNRKTALQVKRYAPGHKVSSDQIQQYASLRNQYEDVTGVTVVTTSSFTRDAKQLANRLEVKMIDGDRLVDLIERHNAEDILEWYAAGRPQEWPQ